MKKLSRYHYLTESIDRKLFYFSHIINFVMEYVLVRNWVNSSFCNMKHISYTECHIINTFQFLNLIIKKKTYHFYLVQILWPNRVGISSKIYAI